MMIRLGGRICQLGGLPGQSGRWCLGGEWDYRPRKASRSRCPRGPCRHLQEPSRSTRGQGLHAIRQEDFQAQCPGICPCKLASQVILIGKFIGSLFKKS